MLRRLQIYYALTTTCVAVQGLLCLACVVWAFPTLTLIYEGMSLKLPLPAQVLLYLGKARLPFSGLVGMMLLGYLSWAWWARPRDEGTSLRSTYVVTALQIPPALLLTALVFGALFPLYQLIGPLG